MIIMGIDPGTAITGYGVIRVEGNRVSWVDSGVIKTAAGAELASKLLQIFDGLSAKIEQFKPHVACIEQAFFAKNVHTTLILGHARGVAMLAAARSAVSVEEYSPREVKKTLVGNGAASKDQVEYMVKFMLSPPGQHQHSDAYDALAVALTGFSRINQKKMELAARPV
jgi:crossover junction endodeoxyribonuclease RuvC